MDLNLKGRRALVCGASKGIGRAVAMELAEMGADVLAVARSEAELKTLGLNYMVADFSEEKSVQSLLNEMKDVQILICNSGGPAGGPLIEASVDDFLAAFQQHLFTNHRLLQKALPSMKAAAYGRVINILSTSVKAPIPSLGVSNTLRAAVASWAKTLSRELGSFGVTVNNVLPGYTDTDRLRSLMQKRSENLKLSFEEVEKQWQEAVPSGRFGKPVELAQAVGFLASPAASYINGINLPVDGGRLESL